MQTQVTKLDFTGQNIYSGIDAHLKRWSVTIMVEGIQCKTFSQNPDAGTLKNYLSKNYPGGNYFSGYEAGFCGFKPHRELLNNGIENIVINPPDIPTTDKEKKQKDDKRDSRKIARALYNNEVEAIHIPGIEIEGLRTLVRYRKTLVKEINRHKYRVKSLLYFNGITIPLELEKASKGWARSYTAWLRQVQFDTEYATEVLLNLIKTVDHMRAQLLQVNRLLRKIEKTGKHSHKIRLLKSIPGIALITSLTIITELDNIKRFRNIDKLASYVGLVPSTRSSGGKEVVGEMTPRGNSQIRTMLIESAWIAIRYDPALMMKYCELKQRMEPNKAIVKIAKKLLSRVRHVLINNEPYEIGVVKNNCSNKKHHQESGTVK